MTTTTLTTTKVHVSFFEWVRILFGLTDQNSLTW